MVCVQATCAVHAPVLLCHKYLEDAHFSNVLFSVARRSKKKDRAIQKIQEPEHSERLLEEQNLASYLMCLIMENASMDKDRLLCVC